MERSQNISFSVSPTAAGDITWTHFFACLFTVFLARHSEIVKMVASEDRKKFCQTQ